MPERSISNQHHATFESIRQLDEAGDEFWSARDLAPLLEYQQWRNFLQVIDKARQACEKSGRVVADHFADVSKMVDIGSGARREVDDLRLSRYACYLIVQNGDPSKPVIANGQTYFALQTRRQELQDSEKFARLSEDEKRLAIRNELAEHTNIWRLRRRRPELKRGWITRFFRITATRACMAAWGQKTFMPARG